MTSRTSQTLKETIYNNTRAITTVEPMMTLTIKQPKEATNNRKPNQTIIPGEPKTTTMIGEPLTTQMTHGEPKKNPSSS